MIDVLKLYEIPFSSNYWETVQKADTYYHKIQDVFSQEFIAEFLETQQELSKLNQDECYREGFRDGLLFMAHSFLSLPGSPRTPSP